MFITIGFIVGVVVGWYVNEKCEDIVALINKIHRVLKRKIREVK